MSPHALRQRMKHGNIYPPERAQIALDRFFTEANLTALRELALRLVASKVEGQLEATIAGRQLPLVTDRVLGPRRRQPGVAAGRASSCAAGGRACTPASWPWSWRRPRPERQSFDRQRDIQEVLDDAVDLGAEVVHVDAKDVVAGLSARRATTKRHAPGACRTGRPAGLSRVLERPVPDRLIEALPDVEFHLVGPSTRTR